MCMIEKNTVVGTKAVDRHEWTNGYGVLVAYNSEADLHDNALSANPKPFGAIVDSVIRARQPPDRGSSLKLDFRKRDTSF